MNDRQSRMKELQRKKEALKAKMEKLRNRKNNTGGNNEEGSSTANKFRQRLTEKKKKTSIIEK